MISSDLNSHFYTKIQVFHEWTVAMHNMSEYYKVDVGKRSRSQKAALTEFANRLGLEVLGN